MVDPVRLALVIVLAVAAVLALAVASGAWATADVPAPCSATGPATYAAPVPPVVPPVPAVSPSAAAIAGSSWTSAPRVVAGSNTIDLVQPRAVASTNPALPFRQVTEAPVDSAAEQAQYAALLATYGTRPPAGPSPPPFDFRAPSEAPVDVAAENAAFAALRARYAPPAAPWA